MITIYYYNHSGIGEARWENNEDVELRMNKNDKLRIISKDSNAAKNPDYRPIVWNEILSLKDKSIVYILNHYNSFKEEALNKLPRDLKERIDEKLTLKNPSA